MGMTKGILILILIACSSAVLEALDLQFSAVCSERRYGSVSGTEGEEGCRYLTIYWDPHKISTPSLLLQCSRQNKDIHELAETERGFHILKLPEELKNGTGVACRILEIEEGKGKGGWSRPKALAPGVSHGPSRLVVSLKAGNRTRIVFHDLAAMLTRNNDTYSDGLTPLKKWETERPIDVECEFKTSKNLPRIHGRYLERDLYDSKNTCEAETDLHPPVLRDVCYDSATYRHWDLRTETRGKETFFAILEVDEESEREKIVLKSESPLWQVVCGVNEEFQLYTVEEGGRRSPGGRFSAFLRWKGVTENVESFPFCTEGRKPFSVASKALAIASPRYHLNGSALFVGVFLGERDSRLGFVVTEGVEYPCLSFSGPFLSEQIAIESIAVDASMVYWTECGVPGVMAARAAYKTHSRVIRGALDPFSHVLIDGNQMAIQEVFDIEIASPEMKEIYPETLNVIHMENMTFEGMVEESTAEISWEGIWMSKGIPVPGLLLRVQYSPTDPRLRREIGLKRATQVVAPHESGRIRITQLLVNWKPDVEYKVSVRLEPDSTWALGRHSHQPLRYNGIFTGHFSPSQLQKKLKIILGFLSATIVSISILGVLLWIQHKSKEVACISEDDVDFLGEAERGEGHQAIGRHATYTPRGIFGKVFSRKRNVFVKTLPKTQAEYELVLLGHINGQSPHIVKILAVIMDGVKGGNPQGQIVLELWEGGNLKEWIRDQSVLSLETDVSVQFGMGVGLGKALVFLAANNIVHRDFKPDNVLLDKSKTFPCLVDFELAVVLSDRRRIDNPNFPVDHGAPECFGGAITSQGLDFGVFSQESDVYSFGVLLIQLFTLLLEAKSVEWRRDSDTSAWKPVFPSYAFSDGRVEAPEEVFRLAKGCLAENPAERPSPREILSQLKKLQRAQKGCGCREKFLSLFSGIRKPRASSTLKVVPPSEMSHTPSLSAGRNTAVEEEWRKGEGRALPPHVSRTLKSAYVVGLEIREEESNNLVSPTTIPNDGDVVVVGPAYADDLNIQSPSLSSGSHMAENEAYFKEGVPSVYVSLNGTGSQFGEGLRSRGEGEPIEMGNHSSLHP